MKTEKGPGVSGGEWRIMEFLWEESPRTMMQIVSAMESDMGWAKSTVSTMLSRMEKKGLVRWEQGERARRYYPLITREEAARRETRSLIDKVYGGSIGVMLSTMAGGGGLSDSEIDELYAILKEAKDR